jgi:hypothetical protein
MEGETKKSFANVAQDKSCTQCKDQKMRNTQRSHSTKTME